MTTAVSEIMTTRAGMNEAIEDSRRQSDYLYRLLFSRSDKELCDVMARIRLMLCRGRFRVICENGRDPEFLRLFDRAFNSATDLNSKSPFDRYVRRFLLFFSMYTLAEVRDYLCPPPTSSSSAAESDTNAGTKRTNRTAFVTFISEDLEQAMTDLYAGVGSWSLGQFVISMMTAYAALLPPPPDLVIN